MPIITLEQANEACNLAARWYYQRAKQPYRPWAGEGVYQSKMPWFLDVMDRAALLLGFEQSLALCALWARCMQETGGAWYDQEQKSDEKCEELYGYQTSKGQNLGNREPGDGAKFKGMGVIQLTGRSNYLRAGLSLDIDFCANPQLVIEPENAARIIHWYFVKEMPSRYTWNTPYQWMIDDNLTLEERTHRVAACVLYGYFQPWNSYPGKADIHGWQSTLDYGNALRQVLGL